MAAKQKWNVLIKEEEIKNGHNVSFLFPAHDLVAVQSRPFMVNYDIYCGSLPTSWALTLIYKHKGEPYEFSLSFTLTRTDRRNDFLNVYAIALLSCLDANNRLVRFTQDICEKRMAVGDVVQGYVEESSSLVSVLKVSLLVQFCHDTKDFDPDASLSSHVWKEVRCLKM
ncbi:hypothetical protein AVEN_166012-1 [Araneus ventricosus]|uniref:MATH domain-containing protein n=1 Tax=Araneus ventricosus TaxID=182803 RepID=A0A4Y2VLL9_ARAVE|nr:hypothetical protein AVEN_166012-1 [Araneus ventricosus]